MRKYLLGTLTFVIAFAILSISVLRSASPRYAFSTPTPPAETLGEKEEITINYDLPYPGEILPDSTLWPLKALRDRLWHLFTFDSSKEAELSLLCADKRLVMSKILFERGKMEIAYSTLTKSEKYLEEAIINERISRQKGENTTELLGKIANSSLKHRQVIDEILSLAPEDARPEIIKVQDYSKNVYSEASDALINKGIDAPKNPFSGE